MTGLKFGTSAVSFGGAGLSFVNDAEPEPIGSGGLVYSFYDLKQDVYTDLMAGHRTHLSAATVAGEEWRAQDFWEKGYLLPDGTLATIPAGYTSNVGFEILFNGFHNNPTYYNGRTLVLERYQGVFKGAGNSMGVSQIGALLSDTTTHLEQHFSGDGVTKAFTFTDAAGWSAEQIHVYVGGYRVQHKLEAVIDYTVADSGSDLVITMTGDAPPNGTDNIFVLIHRRELEIDTNGWGASAPREAGPLPSLNIGTQNVVKDFRFPSIYWKDEEADYRARFKQPRKMFAPWLREYLTPASAIRLMDFYDPMRNTAAVPADMAELTDAVLGAKSGQLISDAEWVYNGGVGERQANPTLPLLDLCKNEYSSVRIPWINLPVFFGMPVYAGTEHTSIQSSGSTMLAYIRFRETVVDLAEAITIDSESHEGVATLDLTNKRIVLDLKGNFSHTDNNPNTEYEITLSFTDVEGNPVTYHHTERIIYDSRYDGIYYPFQGTGSCWVDNETYYDNHWCWDQWADWFIDSLVEAGWSPTDEVFIEYGNELWNSAPPFAIPTSYANGIGAAKALHESSWSGVGYATAKLRKHIDDRLSARGLSFNIRMLMGVQTGNGGYITDARFKGYEGFWKSAQGGSLTGAALAEKVAHPQIVITNYYSSPFSNDGTSNLTGLSDSANGDALIAAFDEDAAQLWSDAEDWYKDPTPAANTNNPTDIKYRISWIENQYDKIQAVAAGYGSKIRSAYEGGSHDFPADISSTFRNYTGVEASYKAAMQGAVGGRIWSACQQRLLAKDPDFMVAAYGGAYEWDWGQPWAFGEYQKAKNGYAQAIANSGVEVP